MVATLYLNDYSFDNDGGQTMKKTILVIVLATFTFGVAGCSPEVGSDAWCKQTKEKSKADWTAGETSDYAKHCIFK